MTVEELDAAADVAGILELGKASLKWAEIDLEHVAVALRYSSGETFLDVQVLRDGQLPAAHLLGVHLKVLPTPDARTHREADEWLVDYGFLRVPHDRRHLRVEKRGAALGLAELLVVMHQVGPQQEPAVHRFQSPEEKIDRLAVGLEQLFELLNHSCSSGGTRMSPKKS